MTDHHRYLIDERGIIHAIHAMKKSGQERPLCEADEIDPYPINFAEKSEPGTKVTCRQCANQIRLLVGVQIAKPEDLKDQSEGVIQTYGIYQDGRCLYAGIKEDCERVRLTWSKEHGNEDLEVLPKTTCEDCGEATPDHWDYPHCPKCLEQRMSKEIDQRS